MRNTKKRNYARSAFTHNPEGSKPTAAGGGRKEASEGQRSASTEGASSRDDAAGYRNRTKVRALPTQPSKGYKKDIATEKL